MVNEFIEQLKLDLLVLNVFLNFSPKDLSEGGVKENLSELGG